MTTPTDDPKVKELLEAAKRVYDAWYNSDAGPGVADMRRLDAATLAFDPPKPKLKVPIIPAWDDLTPDQRYALEKIGNITCYVYEKIRLVTSTAKE